MRCKGSDLFLITKTIEEKNEDIVSFFLLFYVFSLISTSYTLFI